MAGKQLRLRVFAGPNGSGKSTVIEYVTKYKVKNKSIDFGFYINADDIAQQLKDSKFDITDFDITTSNKEFRETAVNSGLVNAEFPLDLFINSYTFRSNVIRLKSNAALERLAQIIADFLRKKLLQEKKRFSFETVFSHHSKLDIMREAKEQGYKVYLYFVSTESPEINKFRVEARVAQGGHNVEAAKIESRYYRSLEYLYEACQLAYQVFFFDNSREGENSKMFAHFKLEKGERKWDQLNEDTPEWFLEYYTAKINTK